MLQPATAKTLAYHYPAFGDTGINDTVSELRKGRETVGTICRCAIRSISGMIEHIDYARVQ